MADADLNVAEGTDVGHRRRRIGVRELVVLAIVLTLLVVPLFRPFLSSYSYVLQIFLVIFMWVAMATSWNIIGGFAGYVSLGHNVFFAVGGYLSGALLVYYGWSPFVTALLAGVVAVGLGTIVGLITLRTRGPAFIISTVALMLMVRIWFDNWELIGGANGLSLPLLTLPDFGLVKVPFYYGMLLCAVGSTYLSYRIKHSKLGLGLRAIAHDEVKAQSAGINVSQYKIIAFAVSGFFVAAVGALWGYSLSYLRPTVFLTLAVAAQMVLMVLLGGRGSIAGPVVGAAMFVLLNEYSVARFGSSEINIAVMGLFLVIVLLFFPEGIVGTLREHNRLPVFLDWD
jgi:branched-chain amino acid transport system permease protein